MKRPPLTGRSWDQVGIVVEDLERAVAEHASFTPGTTWNVYTYDDDAFALREYRGEPGQFTMRLALSDSQPQVELLESLSGPSIYEEAITLRGYGPHHVGAYVESLDGAIEAMSSLGFVPIQMGRGYGANDDGGFAYFDAISSLGTIVEFMEKPEIRRASERTIRFDHLD